MKILTKNEILRLQDEAACMSVGDLRRIGRIYGQRWKSGLSKLEVLEAFRLWLRLAWASTMVSEVLS